MFDLDGTLYNLYNIPNWLDMLEKEIPTVFTVGKPLQNMEYLNKKIEVFQKLGVTFSVVSWLSLKGSDKFNKQCISKKMEWCKKYLPTVKELHFIPYGTPKTLYTKKEKFNYLIDDNLEIVSKFNKKDNCKSLGLRFFLKNEKEVKK